MRLKIAQLHWPIDANEANDLCGTGEWAVRDCEHSNLTPLDLFLRAKTVVYFLLSQIPVIWHYRIDYFRGKKYIFI